MSSEHSNTAVAKIAHHAASLTYEQLPQIAIIRARQLILDTIGTALGGYQTRLGKLAADFAVRMHPGDEATLIADGRRSTVEGAAWANAVMAKHLGMDDSHRTCGHVAAEVVPAVLALAEQHHLSGRQVIVALVAGYDVMNVIQPHVAKWQREQGLDHKGQAGSMAAAVTAAVAMGLDEGQIAHSLALAMDMACGTEQYVYDAGFCDTKDLLAGYAARNGIYAAKLAAFGFQGPPGALDGAYGYFRAFGPGFDPACLEPLGKSYAIAETAFKPHAGCRQVHSCVDAVQVLMNAHHPALDQIAEIEVGIYHKAMTPDFRVNLTPQTIGQAGFSLPVTASVVLTRGSWYREDIETYDSPEAARLRRLVKVYLDAQIEAAYPKQNGCVVRLTMNDGQRFEGRVNYAKGEPENMLSDDEFAQKFRYLNGSLLPEAQVSDLRQQISRLEQLDRLSDVLHLTSPQGVAVS